MKTLIAVAAIVGGTVLGACFLNAAPPEFDAASVKPCGNCGGGGREVPAGGNLLRYGAGRVSGKNVTAWRIILDAYGLTQYQLSGGPNWLKSDMFDLEARAADASASNDQLREMLQSLLARRFRLEFQRESKEFAVYAITLDKSGLGTALQKEGADPDRRPAFVRPGNLHFIGHGPMQVFAERINLLETTLEPPAFGRPVVDKTGLQGIYTWSCQWDDSDDLKAVIRDDLGLKFEPAKATLDALVIDRIEKPSEN